MKKNMDNAVHQKFLSKDRNMSKSIKTYRRMNCFRVMKKIICLIILSFAFVACAQEKQHSKNSTMKDQSTNEFNGRALPENVCVVVRDGGTERPFTGKYWDHHEIGTYICVACDKELFNSDTKYNSGSGWPSFYDVIKGGDVKKVRDLSHGMDRIEIKCGNCDAHLGHVFEDGPNPTGLRYCVNSASLNFVAKEK